MTAVLTNKDGPPVDVAVGLTPSTPATSAHVEGSTPPSTSIPTNKDGLKVGVMLRVLR